MDVTLTMTEWHHAAQTALLRMVVSAAQKLNHASTYERTWSERMAEEMTGAAGEVAVAKVLGAFFVGSVNTFHRVPDCIAGTEVRATERDNGCLILRDNDPDDRRYVLVVGSAPKLRIAGWLVGADGKRPEFLRNPHGHRPAWFVPQDNLRPWAELTNGV